MNQNQTNWTQTNLNKIILEYDLTQNKPHSNLKIILTRNRPDTNNPFVRSTLTHPPPLFPKTTIPNHLLSRTIKIKNRLSKKNHHRPPLPPPLPPLHRHQPSPYSFPAQKQSLNNRTSTLPKTLTLILHSHFKLK